LLIRELVRILLVDDFEPFRSLVSSMLEQLPGFQVIGLARNGLEAAQQAEELRPDLILLDVGLPKLNGIAAAREIRIVSPTSKILFFSTSSPELAREAFYSGGRGYVVKAEITAELLLTAMYAVLIGRQFMSTSFAQCGLIW
jgi:DNA-binding NarL/FixJ family response regulator